MRYKILFFLSLIAVQSSLLFSQSMEEVYASAMDDYARGAYSASYQKFKSYIAAQPVANEQQAAAQFYAADCMNQLQDYESAIFEYERVVTLYRLSNFREEALYKLGLLYYRIKSYARSRDRMATLIDDYPNNEHYGSALYWIGEAFTIEGAYDDAILFFQKAISEKRNNNYLDYSIYTLAGIYEKTSDYKKAVEFYDMLLTYYKNSPLYASAQIRIGYCYFRLKDYENSIIELSNPVVESLSAEKKAEALYMLGNSYFRTGEYDKAKAIFEDILKKYPAVPFIREISYSLAWCYFQKNQYNDAFKTYHSLSSGSDTLARVSLYWEAESQRYLGNDNEALKLYEEFLKKYPTNAMALGVQYQVGVIYFNNKMYEKAVNFLSSASSTKDNELRGKIYTLLGEIELNRKNYNSANAYFSSVSELHSLSETLDRRSRFGLGVTSYCLNQFNETIKILSELELLDPSFETDKVNFYLAESFFQANRYQEAVESYKKININHPELGALALYGSAYCYYNLKDYANASFSFSDFIKKFPKDAKLNDARLRLADTYLSSKKYIDASKIYEDLLKSKTGVQNRDYLSYQYGLTLYKAGKTQNAINEFNRVVTAFPKSVYSENSIYMMGWIRFQQGNLQEAITTYSYLLSFAPRSKIVPLAYYSLGDAHYNAGQYDSAITCYTRVVEGYPNSNYVFDAINGIQSSYVAKGDMESAVSTIDAFVKQKKTSGFGDQLALKKGELYYSQRKYELARSSYEEFMYLFPKSKLLSKAYFWIGKSAQLMNDPAEAIKNFKFIFDTFPASDEAQSAIIEWGQILRGQHEYDQAIQVYQDAFNKIKLPQARAEFMYWKGLSCKDKGDTPTAYDIFDEIVQYYDGNIFADKARLELGIIELDAKRYGNAAKYFQKLSTARTDDIGASSQFSLGMMYLGQGKTNEAITAFVRILNSFQTYDEWVTKSYLRLGDIYAKQKDKKAKDMYRAVSEKHKDDDYGKEAQQKLRKLR